MLYAFRIFYFITIDVVYNEDDAVMITKVKCQKNRTPRIIQNRKSVVKWEISSSNEWITNSIRTHNQF